MNLLWQWIVCALLLGGSLAALYRAFARPRRHACGCKKCPAVEQLELRMRRLQSGVPDADGRPV